MIVTVAISHGFKHVITGKMYSFGGHIHVVLYQDDAAQNLNFNPIQYDQELVDSIRKMPHVKHVAAFVEKPVISQVHGEIEGLFLKGVDSGYSLSDINLVGSKIDFSDSAYSKQIIISQTTADRLNIEVGDTMMLYFIQQDISYPRIRKVKVAGIYHTSVDEIDKQFAICDIRMLQRINGWNASQVNGYQVNLSDEKYIDTVNHSIHAFLQQPKYIGTSALESYPLSEVYRDIFGWLGLLNTEVGLILGIMAVVAIINLASALMILIVDQARMVAIFKALGMEPARLRGVFLYYAGIIAGLGILLGNIFGLGLCILQQKTGFIKLSEKEYFMKYAPIRFQWSEIILINIATLAICVLCMWLPSLYIRYIRPARVLQFK